MRVAVLVLALVGCADEPIAPVMPLRYTCTVLYRCAGDATIGAALTLPCAVDRDDAQARAKEVGIEAATERCATSWSYVRPLCDVYQPAEFCTLEGP